MRLFGRIISQMVSIFLSSIMAVCRAVILAALGLMGVMHIIDADFGIVKSFWYGEHIYYKG